MPITLPFTTGIELEVCSLSASLPDFEQSVSYQGRPCKGQDLSDWKFKYDQSCGPTVGERGYELVSPVIAAGSLDSIRAKVSTAVAYLCRYRAAVNERCGFHIHIGVSHLLPSEVNRLLAFFVRYEAGFFALATEDRRSNRYCAALGENLVQRIKNGAGFHSWKLTDGDGYMGHDRYHWLNGCSYTKYGTLEFRIQGGTLDVDFIVGWIAFIQHVMSAMIRSSGKFSVAKSKSHEPAVALHDLLQRGGCYGAAAEHCKERATFVRKWASKRFAEVNGYQHRTRIAELQKQKKEVAELVEPSVEPDAR